MMLSNSNRFKKRFLKAVKLGAETMFSGSLFQIGHNQIKKKFR